jgi:hypothetical protein
MVGTPLTRSVLRALGVGFAWLALVGACKGEAPTLDGTASAGAAGKGQSGRGGASGSAGKGGTSAGEGGESSGGDGGTSGSATVGGRGGSAATGSGGTDTTTGGSGGEAAAAGDGQGGSTGGTSAAGGSAGTGDDAGAAGEGPSGPAPDSGAPERLAGAVAQCGSAGTLAVIEALARAGIETIDNESGERIRDVTPPVRGLHVWLTQASAMACDIANGAGISGQDLDAMVGPIPLSDADSVAFSRFLAAYVTLADGPFGSQLASELMPDAAMTDHAELVYPTLVVTLFLREVMLPTLVLAAQENAAKVRSWRRPPNVAAAAGDPCAAIAEFLDDLPGAVENAIGSLVEDESSIFGTILDVVATGAGLVAYVGAEAARQVLKHLPGVDALRAAAAAASAVADIRSMFTNWTLELDSAPGTQHKPVGGSATGQFILTVTAPEPGSDWPAPLQSCAQLLGVSLPQFDSANDASVEWEPLSGFPDPISQQSADPAVASGTASMTFNVASEDAAIHVEGLCELTTSPRVKAQLGLPGLDHLGETLAGFMGSPLAQAAVSASASAASKLLGPSKEDTTDVTYHSHEARVDFDGALEKIHVTSSAGIGFDSAWTGTWSMQAESTGALCGAPDVKPVSFQFSGGVADLSASFTQGGGVMDYCNFTFSEPLTIVPDFAGDGCVLKENGGSYTSTMKPPDPMAPEIVTSGTRDGTYTITPVPEY